MSSKTAKQLTTQLHKTIKDNLGAEVSIVLRGELEDLAVLREGKLVDDVTIVDLKQCKAELETERAGLRKELTVANERLKGIKAREASMVKSERQLELGRRILSLEQKHAGSQVDLMLTVFKIPFANRQLREETLKHHVLTDEITRPYTDSAGNQVKDKLQRTETDSKTTEES